jgi:signal transduction histidine kinase
MKLEEILGNAPIMVAVVEGPDHIVTQANQAYLQALGATESVLGQPVQKAFAALYKQHSDHLFEKVRQSGKHIIDYERHLRIRRGKPSRMVDAYFNFAFQPITNDTGAVTGVCLYGMEVTEQVVPRRKYREDKQRELNAQAVQLRQQNDELKELNTSKDEFIALASHQLRTPATGVKQYLGMVLEGYVGDVSPAQREFLQQAYASNERQLSTINDLLQIAQIDANKIVLNSEVCDVGELIDAVADEQKSNIKRRRQELHIIKKIQPALVWADRLRLRMMLDNLVDNASKYSRDRTVITVMLQGDDNHVSISITDQGVGIAEGDYAKLFQKFSRIDNPLSIVVGGNGLGLYLVKKLLDAHGGSIQVTSELQKGTTFTLRLPVPPKV